MDKHVIQFAALGIAAAFALFRYVIPWAYETIKEYTYKQGAGAIKTPWSIKLISLLGILPTLYFIIAGIGVIVSIHVLPGIGLLAVGIIGGYTVWGLWRMKRVAAYLTIVFAASLLLGVIYLLLDSFYSSSSNDAGVIVSALATIAVMAIIIYYLVIKLSSMK